MDRRRAERPERPYRKARRVGQNGRAVIFVVAGALRVERHPLVELDEDRHPEQHRLVGAIFRQCGLVRVNRKPVETTDRPFLLKLDQAHARASSVPARRSHSASSRVVTPSAAALVAFEPASAPITT